MRCFGKLTRWGLALTALGLVSCGPPSVTLLGIRDERLPPSAQRWLADAEDQLSVSRASRDEAARRHAALVSWKRELVDATPGISPALQAMAGSRVEVARLELEVAEAELALTHAKRIRINAETAMQHDLAIYELEPFMDAVSRERERLLANRAELDTARLTLGERTTAFWKAFHAASSTGGNTGDEGDAKADDAQSADSRVLWTVK